MAKTKEQGLKRMSNAIGTDSAATAALSDL